MQTLQYSAVQGLAEFLQNWRDWSWVASLVSGYISMCEHKYESTKIFSKNMLTVFLPKCQQKCDLYYCIKQIGLRLCWQWEIMYIIYLKNTVEKNKQIVPLLILYVCPLTKKWSVYYFNGRFIWTVRNRIKDKKNAFQKSYKLICILVISNK